MHKKTTRLLQDFSIDYLQQKYYSSRMTSSKVYWLLLKSILNDEKNNFITPLFTTNLVIIDLKKKADHFDKKHLWISNSAFHINHRLPTINFSEEDIGKIIPNLNPNEHLSDNNMSIWMLNFWGPIISRILELF